MDLPTALRAALNTLAAGRSQAELAQAGEALSRRYRAETRDGRLHLSDDLTAEAYAVARMPATYAALRDGMGRVAAARPDFAPTSLIDFGAGPGTALWAAADEWAIAQAELVEASASIRRVGEMLAAGAFDFSPRYRPADASFEGETADLVTLGYVLDELDPCQVPPLVERLWRATAGVLLVVEPGTPAGWRRILAVRQQLIAAGAHLVAPCPHAARCPVVEPDWCHFARRLPRSRLHRLVKGGQAPFEDEKFAYVAAARAPGPAVDARVLASPREASGLVSLKLCRADGTLAERLVTRREGTTFKAARRLEWGDAW